MKNRSGQTTPFLHSFRINGKAGKISCLLYPSALDKPCPVILFAHGFPGHEKNYTLAQFLRRAGFNVLIFYYRGCWGSEGTFSFTGSIEDTVDMIDFILHDTEYNFDKKHIFLQGHSFGAPVIARTLEKRPCIYGAIFLMPYDLGMNYKASLASPESRTDFINILEEGAEFLINTSSQEFIQEIQKRPEYFSYYPLAKMLSEKYVFWASGKSDDLAPEKTNTLPFMESLKQYPHSNLQWHSYDTDHYFSDIQERLASEIAFFINDSIIKEQAVWIDEAVFSSKLNGLIEREYKTITSEDAANYFHITKQYFCTLVKKSTNMTFNQLLSEYKLNIAKDLLSKTNLPIAAITDYIGYNDAAYFVRVFKKRTNCTPSEYRKNNKSK